MVTDLSKLSGSEKLRLFLAVELPSPVRDSVARVREAFSASRGLRWVNPDLLHITIRFLGDVPAIHVSLVEEAARYAAEGVQPHTAHVSGIGAFPNDRQPRVLWAGLAEDEGAAALTRLHGFVEAALEARGFDREDRPFSAHITLARTRDDISSAERRSIGDALREVSERVSPAGEVPVDTLTVMRSDLSAAGPRYTPLVRVPLGRQQ